MKILLNITTLIMMLAISACSIMQTSNSDITFEYEIDDKANFKGYSTYQWMGSAAILNDPENQWVAPGFDAGAEIKYLIDSNLRAKGMTEAANKPDILIGYAMGVDMAHVEYKENPDKTFKSLAAAPKGALAIIMIDAQTGFIIYASTAVADVQSNTGDAAKSRLKYAITKMLESLPK